MEPAWTAAVDSPVPGIFPLRELNASLRTSATVTIVRYVVPFTILGSLIACARPVPPVPWSPASSPVGIVLMHGKNGPPRYLAPTKASLEEHGYLVSTPEMCWSDKRMYDRPYPDCLQEIDTAVADLRQRGAKSVVLAGHSMGGTAAIAYGASHDGIAGVIGFASADAYWGAPSGLPDIARAKLLVAAGKGDILDEFGDIRPGGDIRVRTTAANFLSFVAPPSAQMMPANVGRLRTPLLLIGGTRDIGTLHYEASAYYGAPSYALNRFAQVDADHGGTLQAGLPVALDWLAALTESVPPR